MNFDEQAATMDRKQIAELLARNAELTRQLDWLKRQLFGAKSERRFVDPDTRQLSIGEWKQEDARRLVSATWHA